MCQLRRRQVPNSGNRLGRRGLPDLALVDRHTERRVALEMLDGREVLTHRQLQIRDRYVVTQVHPLARGVPDRTQARAELAVIRRRGSTHDLDGGMLGDWLESARLRGKRQLAAGLCEQVQHRTPAAGNKQRVTGKSLTASHSSAPIQDANGYALQC